MSRHNQTSRGRPAVRWTVLALITALTVIAAGGCHQRSSRPQAGGATTRRAQEARKEAEGYALAAVAGAADAQVAAHPELDRRGGFARFMAKVDRWNEPTITVSTTTQTPPSAPQPPSQPAAAAGNRATVEVAAPAHRIEREAPASRRATGAIVIRERIVTEIPYPTEAEAEERTLDLAAEKIAQKLQELDPPMQYYPSRAVVKNEYALASSREVRRPPEFEANALANYDGKDRVYVEYSVEMTADQIRELRTRDRVGYAIRVLGMLTAVSFAGFLFLRLDQWTKGYLTSWLAFVAVALAGGVVAALIIV